MAYSGKLRAVQKPRGVNVWLLFNMKRTLLFSPKRTGTESQTFEDTEDFLSEFF